MTAPDIHQVKDTAKAALLGLPGVVGVGIGPKFTNGARTGELAIVIFVRAKISLSALPPEHAIPAEIGGFKTDVAQGGVTQLCAADDPPYLDERKFRGDEGGLKGGIQLAIKVDDSPVRGTLGCLTYRDVANGRLVYALTCAHVVNGIDPSDSSLTPRQQAERVGGDVGQPSPGGDATSECCTDKIGVVEASRFDLTVDAAIVRVKPKLPWSADVQDIGAVAGTRTLSAQDLLSDVIVRKRGRTTLLTRGVVRVIDQAGEASDPTNGVIVRTYDHQIAIYPTPPFKIFIGGGDSGSLTVDANRNAICLNFAEIEQGMFVDGKRVPIVGFGVGAPIQSVLTTLNVAMATATTPGVVHTVAEVAGAQAPSSRAERSHQDVIAAAIGEAHQSFLRDLAPGSELERLSRHASEIRHLITHQARVAATWRRVRGPALGSRVVSAVYAPDKPIFLGLDPRSVEERIIRLVDVLGRYGSASLRDDIDALQPALLRWARSSYRQILGEAAVAPASSRTDSLESRHG